MKFNSRPFTIGSHRRIIFSEPDIHRLHLGPSCHNSPHNPCRHMLEQLRGDEHLAFQDIEKVGIADGVGKAIAFRRLDEVIPHTQRHSEVRPHCPLLGHHPVKGMEADFVYEY